MGGLESQILESEHLTIGEDRTIEIPVVQSDGSTAQTMTGWTLVWSLMDRPGGTALITKTPTIGNSAGTDDLATITVDAADWTSAGITDPDSLFHVLYRNDSGSVSMLSFGEAVVHAALPVA
jgi:hypothetical protein